MARYRISNATETTHWTVEAKTASDALDVLALKHGFANHAEACSLVGISVQTLIVDEETAATA